jgi:hypothetical protein
VGLRVVRKDHPHNQGESGQAGSRLNDARRREDANRLTRIAQLAGDGKLVLILGREAEALELSGTLEARGCRTVNRDAADVAGEPLTADDRYDAVVVADLLGQIDDPRPLLRALKDQIRPGGTLIVAMGDITPLGDWLAIVDNEPLGARSGVLFTEEGLLGLLEESGYLIGHVDPPDAFGSANVNALADAPGPTAPPPEHDCLIVAHPLPIPGLDFLQRRMRDLTRQNRYALREAEALRRQAAQAEQRLEILAGHERRMAGRIKDLRTRLLDAHAEMIRRDDEIRRTFGDAIFLRNALLIERDALLNQRDALLNQRDALLGERDALLGERDALSRSLHAVGQRLDRFRRSPLGLAYRVLSKLSPRRGTRGGT